MRFACAGRLERPARLHLVPHALVPVADLPVLEILSATQIVADFNYGPLEPVTDYLG